MFLNKEVDEELINSEHTHDGGIIITLQSIIGDYWINIIGSLKLAILPRPTKLPTPWLYLRSCEEIPICL